ncbi:MAG: glycosyltransferase family 4 protein [Vicinamibacterales bacterium]
MARVLLLSLAPERGGAEVVIEQVAQRLDRARLTPVLGPAADSPLMRRWQTEGFEVLDGLTLPRWKRLDQIWLAVRALRRAIVSANIDIVYTHGVAAHILGGRAAASLGLPAVWHVHDVFESRLSADGVLHRLAAATPSRRIIAVSDTVATSLLSHVDRARLTVIPNGVSAEHVTPVEWPDSRPRVVWCGRLQPWKGAHVFLRVARRVHERHADARFVIVGDALFGIDSGYPAQLRADVRAWGLGHVVEFVGHVPDARPWLAAATTVVHCSVKPEPFGLVVAEAMMQMRPVVAYARGGPGEMLREGAGVVVAPDDEAALAEGIRRILAEPNLARGTGARARERACLHYEVGRMSADVEKMLLSTQSG